MALNGDLLRKARNEAGVSQKALAEAAKCVTATDISKAERGIKELTPEQLKAVAKVLKVKPDTLLVAEESPIQLTDAEKELLNLFRAADAETKGAATTVLKGEVPQTSSFMEKIVGMLGAAGGDDPMAALIGMLGNGGGEKAMSALMGMLAGSGEKKDA